MPKGATIGYRTVNVDGGGGTAIHGSESRQPPPRGPLPQRGMAPLRRCARRSPEHGGVEWAAVLLHKAGTATQG